MNDRGTSVHEWTKDDAIGNLVEDLTKFIELSAAGETLDDIETVPFGIMMVHTLVDEVDWIYPLVDLRCEFEKLETYFILQDEVAIAWEPHYLEDATIKRCWEKVAVQEQLHAVVQKSQAFLHLCGRGKKSEWMRVQQKRIMSLFGIAHRKTVASWAESKSFIRKEGRGEYYLDLGHPEVQQALRIREKRMRS